MHEIYILTYNMYIYIYTDMYANIPGIERDAFMFLRRDLGG